MIDGGRSGLVCHIEDQGTRPVFIYSCGLLWAGLADIATSFKITEQAAVNTTASRRVHRPVRPLSQAHISSSNSSNIRCIHQLCMPQ